MEWRLLVVFTLSGTTALVYELIWARLLQAAELTATPLRLHRVLGLGGSRPISLRSRPGG